MNRGDRTEKSECPFIFLPAGRSGLIDEGGAVDHDLGASDIGSGHHFEITSDRPGNVPGSDVVGQRLQIAVLNPETLRRRALPVHLLQARQPGHH